MREGDSNLKSDVDIRDIVQEELFSKHQEPGGGCLSRSQIRDMGIQKTISGRLQYDLEISSFERLL